MSTTDYKVSVPEGEVDGLRVEKYTVEKGDFSNLVFAMRGRGTPPGEYTVLRDAGGVWMSDTQAEIRDHFEAIFRIRKPEAKCMLIQGLGLGMVLKVALAQPHVEHIDVVELDPRVIALVGPAYEDPRLTIHEADAFEQMKLWPTGSYWDVIWHDIWRDICEDNLAEMARLHRSYGRRCGWQGSWSKEMLLSERRRTANEWWRR